MHDGSGGGGGVRWVNEVGWWEGREGGGMEGGVSMESEGAVEQLKGSSAW